MDEQQPLISIVTPSYNQAAFIRATIESVLSQCYPRLEYWVIDGASSDNTIQILEEYEDDPRFHWISEPDGGQGDALAKGWGFSKGDILGWINSDDLYLQGAFEAAVREISKRPGVDLVYTDIDLVNEQGKPIRRLKAKQATSSDQLLLNCHIPQQSVFITREAYDAVDGINRDLHFSLDQDLWLRVLINHAVQYIPKQVWAQQRVHPFAKTQTQWYELHDEWWGIVKRHLSNEKIPENIREEAKRRAGLNQFIASVYKYHINDSINYLKIAISDSFPFGTISEAVKYVIYALHKYDTNTNINVAISELRKKADEENNHLLSCFIVLLDSYHAYQNGDYQKALSEYNRCLQIGRDFVVQDRYFQRYPWLCQYAHPIIKLKRRLGF